MGIADRFAVPPDPVTAPELEATYRQWPTAELLGLRTQFAAHVVYNQKRLDALNAVLETRTDADQGTPS